MFCNFPHLDVDGVQLCGADFFVKVSAKKALSFYVVIITLVNLQKLYNN
jgi:hypothetical protein